MLYLKQQMLFDFKCVYKHVILLHVAAYCGDLLERVDHFAVYSNLALDFERAAVAKIEHVQQRGFATATRTHNG